MSDGEASRAHQWAIRPEHIRLDQGDTASDNVRLAGTVEKYTYLGREAHVLVQTPAGKIVVQACRSGADPAHGAGEFHFARLSAPGHSELRCRWASARGQGQLMRLSFWTLVSIFAWVILIALLVVPLGSVLLSSLQDQAGRLHPGQLCALRSKRLASVPLSSTRSSSGSAGSSALWCSAAPWLSAWRALRSAAAASCRCWRSSRSSRRPSSAPIPGSCCSDPAGSSVRP